MPQDFIWLQEPELTLAKSCQVRLSTTANKIDFEVVGREIRGVSCPRRRKRVARGDTQGAWHGRGISRRAYLCGFRKRGRLAFNAEQVAGSGTENELRSGTVGRAMTVAMILFFMGGFHLCRRRNNSWQPARQPHGASTGLSTTQGGSTNRGRAGGLLRPPSAKARHLPPIAEACDCLSP